jgi:predicted phosphohydrolase
MNKKKSPKIDPVDKFYKRLYKSHPELRQADEALKVISARAAQKACAEGNHDYWLSCKCKNCGKIKGKTEDENHIIDGCVCTICGMEIHNWVFVSTEHPMKSDGTEMPSYDRHKCTKCGKYDD